MTNAPLITIRYKQIELWPSVWESQGVRWCVWIVWSYTCFVIGFLLAEAGR